MSDYIIQTRDLQGANTTLDLLVSTLRELRSQGVSPPIEDMVRAAIEDDDNAMLALARTSLLLVVAIQRLADQ